MGPDWAILWPACGLPTATADVSSGCLGLEEARASSLRLATRRGRAVASQAHEAEASQAVEAAGEAEPAAQVEPSMQVEPATQVEPAALSELAALSEPASEIELARVACEFDYRARRLGVRCGFKALGERTKRHVHTVRACVLRPSAALLALGAAAEASSAAAAARGGGGEGGGGDDVGGRSALEVMPEALRSRWGV